jgi:hypothetical protein
MFYFSTLSTLINRYDRLGRWAIGILFFQIKLGVNPAVQFQGKEIISISISSLLLIKAQTCVGKLNLSHLSRFI